jgi:hypothetical protein
MMWRKMDWLFLTMLMIGTVLFWYGAITVPAGCLGEISWQVMVSAVLTSISAAYFVVSHADWSW